jgi:hypothetical protein
VNGTLGATLVTLAVLASLWLWAASKPAFDQATCSAPVRAADQLVSCTGRATVSVPGGTIAIVTAPSPGAQARR